MGKFKTVRNFAIGNAAVAFVVAIGFLAFSNFALFGCRSKAAEAKTQLRSIVVAQQAHRQTTGTFGASLNEIGFEPEGAGFRYRYRIVRANKDAFLAIAAAAREQFHDAWTVNAKGEFQHTVDGCR